MGKEFIEYKNENGTIPYRTSQVCFCLTKYAKEYINSKRNTTSKIDVKVKDAVLVDAINYLGVNGGIDFGLYTSDLYSAKELDVEVDGTCLLTVLFNHYADYIFNNDMVESVLRNNHMNRCREEFNVNDGAKVLLDFINFIAERNDFDRTFTIRDLYDRAKSQKHKNELRELKSFLELTGEYGKRLNNGENVDSIFNEMAEKHNLKYISKRGVYHYTDKIQARTGQSKMYSWDQASVEQEIYAIAYAYAKTNTNNKEKPKTKIICEKINQMQQK